MCSLKWNTKDDERGNDTHWDIVYALQSSLYSVNNLIFDKTRIEHIFKTTYHYIRIKFVQSIIYYLVIWFILVINLFHKLGLDH